MCVWSRFIPVYKVTYIVNFKSELIFLILHFNVRDKNNSAHPTRFCGSTSHIFRDSSELSASETSGYVIKDVLTRRSYPAVRFITKSSVQGSSKFFQGHLALLGASHVFLILCRQYSLQRQGLLGCHASVYILSSGRDLSPKFSTYMLWPPLNLKLFQSTGFSSSSGRTRSRRLPIFFYL